MTFPGLRSPKVSVWLFRAAVTVIFAYIVNRSLAGGEWKALVKYLEPRSVVFSFCLGAAGLWCQVRRWQIILRYQNLPSRFGVAAKSLLFGSLLAFITPGRAGEFFRGLQLAQGRKTDTVFAVLIDKLFIVLATFATGILCAVLQILIFGIPLPGRVLIISGSAALACAGVASFFLYARPEGDSGGFKGHALRILRLSPRLFTRSGRDAAILSFLAQFFLIAQSVTFLSMFGCGTVPQAFVAIGQAYAFMAFMPVFIANIGIREYSFGLFMRTAGCACGTGMTVGNAALGASMGILVMNLILPACAGLAWNMASSSSARK